VEIDNGETKCKETQYRREGGRKTEEKKTEKQIK
jgi:hypothetical protein